VNTIIPPVRTEKSKDVNGTHGTRDPNLCPGPGKFYSLLKCTGDCSRAYSKTRKICM